MNFRSITLALLFVSTASISIPASAQATSGRYADKRIAINVSPAEKNQVLAEMREFLHGMHGIHISLARQDTKSIGLYARPMGQLLDRMPTSLKEHLPEEFTQLAIAMKEAFENLARDAETTGDISKTHENLAEVMTYCSGCHDTYRFNATQLKIRNK